jgi:hypothetical protein
MRMCRWCDVLSAFDQHRRIATLFLRRHAPHDRLRVGCAFADDGSQLKSIYFFEPPVHDKDDLIRSLKAGVLFLRQFTAR